VMAAAVVLLVVVVLVIAGIAVLLQLAGPD
jgi:hypothetical protein